MPDSLRQTQEIRMQQRLTPMQVQFVRMLEMTTPEIEGGSEACIGRKSCP